MAYQGRSNRWRRYSDWDERPLRLDLFAKDDPANGFSAFNSPADPKPGLEIEHGCVASMDGVPANNFDMIDAFIAEYHLDVEVAKEAMAMDSLEIARKLVDMNVPRKELVRLARGLTPAKLADVMSRLMQAQRGRGGLFAFSFTKAGTLDPKVLLETFLPDDLPPRIEDLAIPFTAVSVDFLTGEEVHFSSGPLITALAASIAVPAIIKPVQLNGRILIDGGAANPMPHDVAGSHGEPVIACDVIGLRSPKSGGIPTPAESIYGAAVIMMQSIMRAKAALVPPALMVAPDIHGYTLFDFFKAGDVIAAGENAGREVEAFLKQMI